MKSTKKKPKFLPQKIWDEIRARYEMGEGPSHLARRYGCSIQTIFTRRKREGWAKKGSRPVTDKKTTGLKECSKMETPGQSLPATIGEATARQRALELADVLHEQLRTAVHDVHLDVKDKSKLGRALLDLTNALERLFKVELQALGVGDGQKEQRVIILVPQKLSKKTWQQKALAADWEDISE